MRADPGVWFELLLDFSIEKDEGDMPDVERTRAGFQVVMPGCERRTMPKSTTSSDDAGQGLLDFYRPPTLREKLAALAEAPLQPKRPKR